MAAGAPGPMADDDPVVALAVDDGSGLVGEVPAPALGDYRAGWGCQSGNCNGWASKYILSR